MEYDDPQDLAASPLTRTVHFDAGEGCITYVPSEHYALVANRPSWEARAAMPALGIGPGGRQGYWSDVLTCATNAVQLQRTADEGCLEVRITQEDGTVICLDVDTRKGFAVARMERTETEGRRRTRETTEYQGMREFSEGVWLPAGQVVTSYLTPEDADEEIIAGIGKSSITDIELDETDGWEEKFQLPGGTLVQDATLDETYTIGAEEGAPEHADEAEGAQAD